MHRKAKPTRQRPTRWPREGAALRRGGRATVLRAVQESVPASVSKALIASRRNGQGDVLLAQHVTHAPAARHVPSGLELRVS